MSRSNCIIISVNTSWNIVNFRMSLLASLKKQGFIVRIIAPRDKYSDKIINSGFPYSPLLMKPTGRNPTSDMFIIFQYIFYFIKYRPLCVLLFTAKPNIYGSLAASFLGVPTLNNIAGMGGVYSSMPKLSWLVDALYRFSLNKSKIVFFQNAMDKCHFLKRKIVRDKQAVVLPGSGVNLDHFRPRPYVLETSLNTKFLFIGRLIREKGVIEYVKAARILRGEGLSLEFSILGFIDERNIFGIKQFEVQEWVAEGVVRYLGAADDVREHIAATDCVVLPSWYREGTPKSLLEAAAMAKPIITTDMPGCRDVVDDGVTGYLCRPKDIDDLVCKMRMFAKAPMDRRAEFGAAAREKMEREFDEAIVLHHYARAIAEIAN